MTGTGPVGGARQQAGGAGRSPAWGGCHRRRGISGTYLENMTQFPDLEVLFVADLDTDRARAQAEAYGVPGTARRPSCLRSMRSRSW